VAGKLSLDPKVLRQPSPATASGHRIFDAIAEASSGRYARARDLPCLIALWPRELADSSAEGNLRILAKLERALRAERRRGLAGHWSYDLNRHLGLLRAYKGELALIGRVASRLSRNARVAARPTAAAAAPESAGKAVRRWPERSR
jgi:hypothetical protein